MKRPAVNEYPPFFQRYIDRVEGDDFFTLLDNNTREAVAFFRSIDGSKHGYRYAEDKWTIKDVVLHIIDMERVFSYRALVCVRGDVTTPLHPVDENLIAANASTSDRTMEDLMEEFEVVRSGFRKIFQYTTGEQQQLLGSGVTGKISGRALGYIGIGHVIHHMNIIKERYL